MASPQLMASSNPPSKSRDTTANPDAKPTIVPPGTTSGSSQSNTGGSRSRQDAGSAAAMPGGSGAGPSSGPASAIGGSGSTGASAAGSTNPPASHRAAKPPTPAANASPGVGKSDRNVGGTVPTKGAVDKDRMTGPSGTPQK